jgi:chromatin remodeling complex protein RSC6
MPSNKISHIVGKGATTRSAALKKVWEHIRANQLQNHKKIHIDSKLAVFIPDRTSITMFELPKYLFAELYSSAKIIKGGSTHKVIKNTNK